MVNKETLNYGWVTIENIMIDTDGTHLEEGIKIVSDEELFNTIEIEGFSEDDIISDSYDLDTLIEINL